MLSLQFCMFLLMRASRIAGGGVAKVVDSQGHVWLDYSVSLSVIGLSTKLVEASVVVCAVIAIAEFVSFHGVCLKEI